jgi:hypothetical protein
MIRKGLGMAKRFEGIYPPVITSFTESGDIYEKGIRQVIGYLMSEGVHGFFINGSYGSCVLMTIERSATHHHPCRRCIHAGDDRTGQTRRGPWVGSGGGRSAILLFRSERLR